MPTAPTLSFGYRAGLPDDAKAAFGARLIVTQDGSVDFVPDRVSVFVADGVDKAAFLAALNAEYRMDKLLGDVKSALKFGALDTRGDDFITVICGRFTMKASCQSSAGYCYVTVYATELIA